MADEIIKRLSSIEIGDGDNGDSSSPKTKSLIGNGDDSESSPPKKVTTLFQWPSSSYPKEDKSETESTEMTAAEYMDAGMTAAPAENIVDESEPNSMLITVQTPSSCGHSAKGGTTLTNEVGCSHICERKFTY